MVPMEQQRSLSEGTPLPETRPAGSESLHWPTLPQKSRLGPGSTAQALLLPPLRLLLLLTLSEHRHCQRHIPSPLGCPTHACSQAQSGEGGRVAFSAAAARTQGGLGAWETGRSCQHPINRGSSSAHDTQGLRESSLCHTPHPIGFLRHTPLP